MTRNLGLFRWVGVSLLATISACVVPPDNRIQIRYMAWGNPQQLDLEKKLCAQFNQRHPNVNVRFLQVPASAYGNKMMVMLSSRTAPDVMRVDQMVFPRLVKRENFRALDDLVAGDPTFRPEDFFPSTLEECTYNGKLYGLNVLFGGIIVYYNKTMVRAAGLEDPFELWKQGKWTWDRYLDHAKRMTVKGPDGRYRQFGAAIPTTPQVHATIRSLGGEVMDETKTRVVMGSGKSVDAWRFWYELRYVHGASPTPSQSANSAFSFESGKLGMQFDWMGLTPRLREAATGFDWDVVPIPTGPGGHATAIKGNQLVMYRESKHPKEAWEFMKFITSEEVETILAVELRRTFPSRKSVAYSEAYQKSTLPPFNMRTFTYAVETGRPLPITSRWGDWVGEFNSGIEGLLNGRTKDVAAAAGDAEARANEALAVPEGL